MSCIYKNKGSGRHCSKEGNEGQFCLEYRRRLDEYEKM